MANKYTFVPYLLYFFKGISALIELPKNCVAAAVGKELSEYAAFLLSVSLKPPIPRSGTLDIAHLPLSKTIMVQCDGFCCLFGDRVFCVCKL